MSEDSSGTVPMSAGTLPICKKCVSLLQYDIVCSSCGCIGEDETNVRRCGQCYGYMYEDSSICLWCGHDRAFTPSHKPCFLCCNLLPLNNDVCETCQTRQDMDVLKGELFKKCLNSNCHATVSIRAMNCYLCKQRQDPSTSTPGFDFFSSGQPNYLESQAQYNAKSLRASSHNEVQVVVGTAESEVKNTSIVENKGVRKCKVCESLFSESMEQCNVCFAQQDVDLLRTLQFNNCTSGCGAILCVESHKCCFRCKEQQQHPLSTFSGLEVFPKEVLNPPISVESPAPRQKGHSDTQSEPEKLSKKPCILCGTAIPASSKTCFTCHTTQIEDELKYSRSKLCSYPKCEAPMSVDLQVCYRCKQDQNRNRFTFITDPQYQVPALNTDCISRGDSKMEDKERKTRRDEELSSWDILHRTKDGKSQAQSLMPDSACDKNIEKSDMSKTTQVELNRYDQQHSDGKITKAVTCEVDNSAKNAQKDDRKDENVSASGKIVQKSKFEEKKPIVKAVSCLISQRIDLIYEIFVYFKDALGLFPQCKG